MINSSVLLAFNLVRVATAIFIVLMLLEAMVFLMTVIVLVFKSRSCAMRSAVFGFGS